MAGRKPTAAAPTITSWGDVVVRPQPGEAVLLRQGDVVVLVAADGADDAVDAVLRLARQVADDGGDGRRLVRQLAALLAEHDTDAPSLVATAPVSDGLAVLVHGSAEVTTSDASGHEETLSGRTSSAWVDRVVPLPLASLEALVGDGGVGTPAPDPRFELTAGVMAAGGFAAVPRGAEAAPAAGPTSTKATKATKAKEPARTASPSPAPSPEPVVDDAPTTLEPLDGVPDEPPPAVEEMPSEPPAFESVLLVDTHADLSAASAPHRPAEVVVDGIMCKREHFNNPRAAFCGVCGISMVQQTHQVVQGPRPPLGVLVFDDGTTFTVDGDYLIGRDPVHDADVAAGRTRGLAVIDEEGTVSRAHALLRIDGWEVTLTDHGSANGTYVAPPGTTGWTPLAPGDAVVIVPGTRVQLGRRTFVFDAHNRV